MAMSLILSHMTGTIKEEDHSEQDVSLLGLSASAKFLIQILRSVLQNPSLLFGKPPLLSTFLRQVPTQSK